MYVYKDAYENVFEQLQMVGMSILQRLVYTVFCVQGNYTLSGLWVRGVSTIQGF